MKMNRIKFLILLSILFFGCKENHSQKSEKKEISVEKKKGEKEKISPQNLKNHEIPKEIQWEGKIKNAIKWTDSEGENIVITAETGIYLNSKFQHEMEGSDAEIFAYRFQKIGGKFQQIWRVYDFIHDCPMDITMEFLDKTFQITDLDNDGVAEIWLMYKMSCRGDVSPDEMKIIMYEGKQKHAIRGENRIQSGVDEHGKAVFDGGEYQADKAFSTAPVVFLDFAKKMWEEKF